MDFVRRVLLGVFAVTMFTCVPLTHFASVGWAQQREGCYFNECPEETQPPPPPIMPPPIMPPPTPMTWICQTPFIFCPLVQPLPVGVRCFCPTMTGPVWGYTRP